VLNRQNSRRKNINKFNSTQ